MLEIRNVTKKFGSFTALDDVTVMLKPHECLVICGPSGSGKSTLVRCVNMIESRVDSGEILYRGKNIYARGAHDVRKKIGMVFQQFNLFYHLTVEQNIMLAPMHVKGVGKAEAREKASALLARVDLADKAQAYPIELSGGQKQRAAICRCLALEPDIILFDEPTSALDPEMIKEVLDIMKALASAGTSMICVTHELGFAKEVADRIIFMETGKNIEENNSQDFFEHPKSIRTRAFINQILKV
ncbi:MAG: amino acid ABC transporter ATP-binding protein [Planctomycetota bacterium]|nr:amino acid ABC transporter ATP-binding protein [Planctomycetota bacterium]